MHLNTATSMTIEAITAPPEIPDLRKKSVREELERVVEALSQEGVVRTCHMARIKPEKKPGDMHARSTILDVAFVGPTVGRQLPVEGMVKELRGEYEDVTIEIRAGGVYGVLDASEKQAGQTAHGEPEIRSLFYFITDADMYSQVDDLLMNPKLQSPDQIQERTPFAHHIMEELGLLSV